MTDKIVTAQVSETGASAYAVDIEVSGHSLKGDEPVEVGGGNLGPAPYDMLTAALGECTAMTLRWYAIQQKWPLDKVEVKLTHHKEGKQDIFTKEITIHGDALSDDQRKKLIEIAAKCPVQRTLEGTPIIKTL
jgi:putative redox protein